jgi:hypothetical protein
MEAREEKVKDGRDKVSVVITPEVRAALDDLADAGLVVAPLILDLLEAATPGFHAIARATRAAKAGKQLEMEEIFGEVLSGMGERMQRKRGRPRGSKNKPKEAPE